MRETDPSSIQTHKVEKLTCIEAAPKQRSSIHRSRQGRKLAQSRATTQTSIIPRTSQCRLTPLQCQRHAFSIEWASQRELLSCRGASKSILNTERAWESHYWGSSKSGVHYGHGYLVQCGNGESVITYKLVPTLDDRARFWGPCSAKIISWSSQISLCNSNVCLQEWQIILLIERREKREEKTRESLSRTHLLISSLLLTSYKYTELSIFTLTKACKIFLVQGETTARLVCNLQWMKDRRCHPPNFLSALPAIPIVSTFGGRNWTEGLKASILKPRRILS